MSNLTFSFPFWLFSFPALTHTHTSHHYAYQRQQQKWEQKQSDTHSFVHLDLPQEGCVQNDYTAPNLRGRRPCLNWLHCAIWKCGKEGGHAQYIATVANVTKLAVLTDSVCLATHWYPTKCMRAMYSAHKPIQQDGKLLKTWLPIASASSQQ